MTYVLSDTGRKMTYVEWRKIGGNGIPNSSRAPIILGAQAHWQKNLTLGEIQDACIYTGRCLAGFAKEHLKRHDMAIIEVRK